MDSPALSKPKSTFSLVISLPANFWFANLMEMFERLAFFGVRAIAPLYLVGKASENGLGLTYTQKGSIYAWWALIQCLVPMVSGGYTERYGYRKTLSVAFIVNILGYLLMAQSLPLTNLLEAHGWADMGYWVFLAAACLVAFGTAVFKPPCHGTIAKTTDESTSSMGWGLFYWVVNIGGALAPMAAAELRGDIDWDYVFYGAAFVTAFNFLPLFILYREPAKTPPKEGEKQQNAVEVFLNSIFTILKDFRLVVFLLIFSCFWLMFMQLWDLLPNFIDEWVDTSDIAPYFGRISDGWVLPNGQTKPEMLINIDSISIIAFVLVISWLIRKINKVAAMIIGMLIALVGFVTAGMTQIGWICAIMIFVFAIGEMLCSPTFSAYVGLIAPKDKKALYMGYSNIPFAIGWALGNLVGGYFYDNYSAKAELALKYLGSDTKLVAQAVPGVDWSDSLEYIPELLRIERREAFALAQQEMELDATATADKLRELYRYDRGQAQNLALLALALDPEKTDQTIKGYAALTIELAQRSQGDGECLKNEVAMMIAERPKDSAAPASAPASQPVITPETRARIALLTHDVFVSADEIKKQAEVARRLALGELTLQDVALADVTHYLPDIVGKKRDDALTAARDLLNKNLAEDQQMDETEIVAELWIRFGSDPAVLNNLALEYLAQATDRVSRAVAALPFSDPDKQLKKRLSQIERHVGLNKDKAFAALAIALPRDAAEVAKELDRYSAAGIAENDRVYVLLAEQGEARYQAVRAITWKYNTRFLRELIKSDDQTRQTVLNEIDKVDIIGQIVGFIRRLFGAAEPAGEMTEEGINYQKLALKQDLIQKALSLKDWTKTPLQARQLLAMNPFEARAAAATDVDAMRTVLWDKYRPYMVWVYLGGFGVAGTIGMILFYFATRKSAAARTETATAA